MRRSPRLANASPDRSVPRLPLLGVVARSPRQIAAACDVLIAFVAHDRKGGTENTIEHARRLGKPVRIMEEK